MATILNKASKPVDFDVSRHALEVDGKGATLNARVIVANHEGIVALRLLSNPDKAEWVRGGLEAFNKRNAG